MSKLNMDENEGNELDNSAALRYMSVDQKRIDTFKSLALQKSGFMGHLEYNNVMTAHKMFK